MPRSENRRKPAWDSVGGWALAFAHWWLHPWLARRWLFFAILSRIAAAVFGAIFPGAFLVLNHIRARVKAIAEQQKR